MLHRGSSWPRLAEEGGEHLITSSTELYCGLNLLCDPFFMPAAANLTASRLTEYIQKQACKAMDEGH